MKSDSKFLLRFCLIIYFILITVFFCHLLIFTDIRDFLNVDKVAKERDYTTGWVHDSGKVIDINRKSAGDYNGVLCVSKELPSNIHETDAVYFSTSNLRFKVYVDEEEIYTYDTEENITGMGDGISYHMIGLGTKDQGKVMRIEGETVFSDGHGGRINDMQYGAEELYRYYMTQHNLLGLSLSVLMIIFGLVTIAFSIGMYKKNDILRSAWALGLSSIMFGLWSLCDTGVPQLWTGCTYASREVIYIILHLAGFPLIWFVNSTTKAKKKLFVYLSFILTFLSFGWMMISYYVFGKDLHTMVSVIYASYGLQLLILAGLIIDNEIYCHQIKVKSRLRYFYIGAGIFVDAAVIDMIRYLVGKKSSMGHGSWFRFGLTAFFIFMAFQIFYWWYTEKSSLERDRFVNRLLQYVMGAEDPEVKINKVLEYMCNELHADRAYIFEDMKDGTFDNTYEYCAEGVTAEIDNLKGLPYEGVVDVWYQEYRKGGHILIYDIEKYRDVSKNMYDVLEPQGIETLVTGPLILDGKYIGFFGVDNPPVDMMKEISEIIRLLMFFLSEMIALRDSHLRLVEYSYHDALTKVGNRHALQKFEKEVLDTSRSYGFIMCDINGLKAVNDNEGHEAGDNMIKAVASCLTEVFGAENVYRMGGDEFSVYAYEDTLKGFEEKIANLRALIGGKNIYAAIGYTFAEDGDPDYSARRVEADNRMYDEKRAFYNGNKDRRKKTLEN